MTREQAIMTLMVVDENATCDDCLYYNQMEDCPNDEDCIIRQALDMAIKALEQEPKTGHWIDDNGIYAWCSCCKEHIYQTGEFKYCPNCGADMRGDTE